jgi:hypothetical protein
MTSLETLECRRNVAEDELFRVEASLNRHLDRIEAEVTRLADEIQQLVRRSGRIPIDQKTIRILGGIQTSLERLDLPAAQELASRVSLLRRRVTAFEGAIDGELAARSSLEDFDQDVAVSAA